MVKSGQYRMKYSQSAVIYTTDIHHFKNKSRVQKKQVIQHVQWNCSMTSINIKQSIHFCVPC